MIVLIVACIFVDNFIGSAQRRDLGLCSKCGGVGLVPQEEFKGQGAPKVDSSGMCQCDKCGGSGEAR